MVKSSETKIKEKEKAATKAKRVVRKPGRARVAKKPVAKTAVKPAKTTPARRKVALKKETLPPPPIPKIKQPEKTLQKEAAGLGVAPVSGIQEKIAAPIQKIIPAKITPEEIKITKKEVIEAKVAPPPLKEEIKELELKFPVTVKDLAVKLQEKPSVVIKNLMDIGVMAGINQALEDDLAAKICDKFGFRIRRAPDEEELALRIHQQVDEPQDLQHRPPIVTFMGHVDHGKTSLLDAIRKTKVTEIEHGGITQHIGAYRVVLPNGEITFLDTPGHEAFTAMRARGVGITDIVVLVIAADEGIMPQTQEAIDHARAAGVPIVVAMNKVDKPQANIDRLKKQLSDVNLTPEDWGGKTITVPVSAKTGQGIDELLEMILLEAQMLDLKANARRLAKGVIVEAKLTKDRGPIATLLVQNGTLRINENIIVDKYYGKVKAMVDDHGKPVTEAGPSFPVEIFGLLGAPLPGEQFFVIEDEKTAKELALKRQESLRQQQMKSPVRINLENLYSQIKEGKLKELKLIIKADVQGSLEAIKETLNKLNISEIKLDIIHGGVGNINSSDIVLAVASDALILGFNITTDERARELISKEGVDVRTYNIIYELANDIKAALEGMLEPKLKKVFLGKVEVRKVFKLSRAGTVAGCFVTKGRVTRAALINLIRNGEVVFDGKISSLKRFKDDVREVAEGFECGITLEGFDDLKEGDIIEAYEIEKIARKL